MLQGLRHNKKQMLQLAVQARDSLTDLELCDLARSGDHDAERIMLGRYAPLVDKIAATTRLAGLESGDIVSLANLAMIRAIRKFNYADVRFGMFAKRCIANILSSEARFQRRRLQLVQHDREGADGLDLDEMFVDPEDPHDFVLAAEMVERVRQSLTPMENTLLDKILARGGYSTDSTDDQTWRQVADELGMSRTKLWRHVLVVSEKTKTTLQELGYFEVAA